MNERRQAGANYIISLFNEVQNLNQHFSLYQNFIIQLGSKYPNNEEDLKNIEEEEKNILITTAQNCRHFCNKAFILFYSISSVEEDLQANKDHIEGLYNKAIEKYIINLKDLKFFVLEINKALVNNIIQDLLKTSEDIVNDIYDNSTNTTQSG